MMNKRSFFVSLFDFVVICVTVNSQNFVVIFSQRLLKSHLGILQILFVLYLIFILDKWISIVIRKKKI